MKNIDAFILFSQPDQAKRTVEELRQSALINNIFLLSPEEITSVIEGCEKIVIDNLQSTQTIKRIAQKSTTPYTLIYQKPTVLKPGGYFALERMVRIADDTQAGMVYADYYAVTNGEKKNNPLIEYQEGSLRDDFNFGSLLLYNTTALKDAAMRMRENYPYAGLYDLRLKVSQKYPVVHINEYLYTEIEEDTRASGQKIFDYVDPKNRQVQIEMEQACTQHLKDVGAFLEPAFEKIEFNRGGDFEYEASVIIPVRNRIKTIRDAISSVLMQKADFPFNLIVVDNHSTDGTTEAIDSFKMMSG